MVEPFSISGKEDEYFFKNYQHDTLLVKASIIKRIIENSGNAWPIIDGNQDGIVLKDKSANINTLKAEIHFTMYQALESLLAVCLAFIKSPEKVWYWLSSYKFGEFAQTVDLISKHGLSKISGKSEEETISALFFTTCPKEFIESKETKIEIQHIAELIRGCATLLSDKEDYNSYKHGLRCIRGVVSLQLEKDDGTTELALDQLCTTYLSLKIKSEDKIVTKIFDYNRDYEIIKLFGTYLN